MIKITGKIAGLSYKLTKASKGLIELTDVQTLKSHAENLIQNKTAPRKVGNKTISGVSKGCQVMHCRNQNYILSYEK